MIATFSPVALFLLYEIEHVAQFRQRKTDNNAYDQLYNNG